MISDSAEATVKSLDKPTPKRIEDIVAGTIHQKRDDGQFDECDLTMREINEVQEAVVEALIGFLGPRIEYPAGSPNKINGANANGVVARGASADGASADGTTANGALAGQSPEGQADATSGPAPGTEADADSEAAPNPAGKPT
jgi:hypothetical protein